MKTSNILVPAIKRIDISGKKIVIEGVRSGKPWVKEIGVIPLLLVMLSVVGIIALLVFLGITFKVL